MYCALDDRLCYKWRGQWGHRAWSLVCPAGLCPKSSARIIGGAENTGPENAGSENAGPMMSSLRDQKCSTGKCETASAGPENASQSCRSVVDLFGPSLVPHFLVLYFQSTREIQLLLKGAIHRTNKPKTIKQRNKENWTDF